MGGGQKSSVCPSKPGKSNFFGGISRDFAGISRRCPKSLRKKKFVFNYRPLQNGPFGTSLFDSNIPPQKVGVGHFLRSFPGNEDKKSSPVA